MIIKATLDNETGYGVSEDVRPNDANGYVSAVVKPKVITSHSCKKGSNFVNQEVAALENGLTSGC